MPSKRLLTSALLAAGALAVSAPAASATTVRENSGTGAPYSGAISAVSNELLFATGSGTVECARSELKGTVTSAGTGEITGAKFEALPSSPNCNTSFSPSGTTAKLVALGVPWALKITWQSITKIPVQLTGTLGVNLGLEMTVGTNSPCFYAVAPGGIAGKWRNLSEYVLLETKFELVSGPASCPAGGSLRGPSVLPEGAAFGVVPIKLFVGS
jgi:hypothetical protein